MESRWRKILVRSDPPTLRLSKRGCLDRSEPADRLRHQRCRPEYRPRHELEITIKNRLPCLRSVKKREWGISSRTCGSNGQTELVNISGCCIKFIQTLTHDGAYSSGQIPQSSIDWMRVDFRIQLACFLHHFFGRKDRQLVFAGRNLGVVALCGCLFHGLSNRT